MNANKILIIVDMQKDFIDGSLANGAAQDIVDDLCEYIDVFGRKYNHIILTRDTHGKDYLESPEGLLLPVKHCIKDTAGWLVNDKIVAAVEKTGVDMRYIDKPTFGYKDWDTAFLPILNHRQLEIDVVGTCTDICVISNALILKAMFPSAYIRVIENLCAGLTPEKHKAAIEVAKSCQVTIGNYDRADLEPEDDEE